MSESERLQLLARIKTTQTVYEAALADRDAARAVDAACDTALASARAKYAADDARTSLASARDEYVAIEATYEASCAGSLRVYEKEIEYSRTFLLRRAARASAARTCYDVNMADNLATREINRTARANYDADFNSALDSALADFDSERACARAEYDAARAAYDSARANARADYAAALEAAFLLSTAPRTVYDSAHVIARADYSEACATASADYAVAHAEYDAARDVARANFNEVLANATCEAAYASVRATDRDANYAERASVRASSRAERVTAWDGYVAAAIACDADRATSRDENDDTLDDACADYNFARAVYNDAIAECNADYDSAHFAALTCFNTTCAAAKAACEASLADYATRRDSAYTAYKNAQADDDVASAGYRSISNAKLAKTSSACDAAQTEFYAALAGAINNEARTAAKAKFDTSLAAAMDDTTTTCEATLAGYRKIFAIYNVARDKYIAADDALDAARKRGLAAYRANCDVARADYYSAITVACHVHITAAKKSNVTCQGKTLTGMLVGAV
jgi:hypothetical protein